MEWDRLLSRKRWKKSAGESSVRGDYDTIICSTLFRRLQDKAQVFPLDNDDYVRTRLTHSLEVSAIGKRVGEYAFSRLRDGNVDRWFQSNSVKEFTDVLLSAGLVHDIGNPPFGHFGEYAIREWFSANLGSLSLKGRPLPEILSGWQKEDLCSFEGNAQSLRLLSRTPYLGRNIGFNLSYRVLGTIMKYPVSSAALKEDNPRHYRKMGYYYSERELFDDMCATMGLDGCRHPLSFLLEAADDIAYRTSDLEDAVVKKVISFPEIVGSFSRLKGRVSGYFGLLPAMYEEEVSRGGLKSGLTALQRWNQHIQGVMVKDAGDSFLAHYDEIMDGSFDGDLFCGTVSGEIIDAIAELSERSIYTSSLKIRPELSGRHVIDSLMSCFMPAAIIYDTDEAATFIEKRIIDTISDSYKSMYRSEATGQDAGEKLYLRILMVTDFISGMTDNYAKRLYLELFA